MNQPFGTGPAPSLPPAIDGELRLDNAAIDRAFRWLLREGRIQPTGQELIRGLGAELSGGGFPLMRMLLAKPTLHPQIASIAYRWSRAAPEVEAFSREHDIWQSDQYLRSPMALIYAGEPMIRRRLFGPGLRLDFPILEDLLAEGGTDYAIFGLRRGDGRPMAVISIATDAAGGFSDEQFTGFQSLLPLLSLIVEAIETRLTAKSLLEIYLGADAGRRVMGGLIRRGESVTIAAAIWQCDLRDFTAMSNQLPRDEVLAILNDYFDAVTRPVMARGGEILKFIGDAVLAIFPMRDDLDRDEKCLTALTAAEEALDALRDVNELRASAGKQPLSIGIGLHAGSVSYGNIGSQTRLDFTVIGPAVNLAARITGLCRPLNQPLLASKAFASPCGSKLVPLGHYPMHGFDQPQEVHGLPE
ncbi:MAG TPA: adenylate/guanylate cyclase domain-containing protein [Dongiaceae bacterium]|jgi:adenylate cyclase|nr:adenylate/guanylate cyclase domain-containing protein [Dongiaceae bacterium]